MFVMRTNSISNDAAIKHKAGKQKLGRHIGESPTALLLHRNELVRSDLPLLFIQNSFTMRTKKSDWNVAEVQVSYKPTHDRTVKITSSDDAHRVLRQMWDADMLEIQEQFCVLFMNNANEVIGFRCLHTGTTTASMVDLKLLLSLGCKMLAHSIIIAHNHPSGNTKVSVADKHMTWKIKDAAEMLDITLHDHIILTSETYVSLADHGIIL
jgi:DNA repair protein RadC